jgi:diguanylate cyclase (GGDEF)-like protein
LSKLDGKAAPEETAAGTADQAFVQALIGVYRELDVPDLLRALLTPMMEWTGAGFGAGLGLAQERRVLVPMVGVPDREDARFASLSGVDPDRLKSWLDPRTQTSAAFGAAEPLIGEWPGEPPAWTMVVPVIGPVGSWAGLLILCLDHEPATEAQDRVARLAEMARPAVGNALRLLSMRELVIKDDTASCFNRRHFEEFLPEELSRASRFRSPVSLIFLDMDNLKQVNSQHGHSMGSRTLYEVSVRVRSKIRKFDKLFRFGGDEFCIVLPETEWHGALEVAERVGDVIGGRPFLTRELGKTGVQMSASLGIASFPLHARSQRDLIQRADEAMQKVKNSGKNAIGVAEITGGEDGD